MPNQDDVRRRFENPERYLGKPFGVAVRSLVVRRLLGRLEGASVLDIGCGDGSLSLPFASPGNALTLVDMSPGMLERARRNLPAATECPIEFHQMDFRLLDRPGVFDVVLCMGVLAHVDSVEDALKKVVSFLKPGGRALFQITDRDAFLARVHSAILGWATRAGHEIDYQTTPMALSSFLNLIQRSGLEILEQCRYSLLLPGMGRLPNRWLLRYELASLNRPSLSRFGTEVILLARKTA